MIWVTRSGRNYFFFFSEEKKKKKISGVFFCFENEKIFDSGNVVGNLSVGGTGKYSYDWVSDWIDWNQKYQVRHFDRGYGKISRGFLKADRATEAKVDLSVNGAVSDI